MILYFFDHIKHVSGDSNMCNVCGSDIFYFNAFYQHSFMVVSVCVSTYVLL